MSFHENLAARQDAFGPICVGLDPHTHILTRWGLPDTVSGLAEFSAIMAEAFAGKVASIKPQVAFFERFGSAGLAVLEETIGTFRDSGVLVIADAKRGDIGSTMAGYASAWLESPLAGDAVTLSPYLGVGSLAPALEKAHERGKGVFVLALTSNPEGASVQGSGSPVLAARILAELGDINERLWGGPGSVGAVVGATTLPLIDAWGIDTSVLRGPLLAPGVGAQGATVAEARRVAGDNLLVIPVSRAILGAGPDPENLRRAYSEFL